MIPSCTKTNSERSPSERAFWISTGLCSMKNDTRLLRMRSKKLVPTMKLSPCATPQAMYWVACDTALEAPRSTA